VTFIIKYISAFITGLSQATHPSNMYKDEELRVKTLADVMDKRTENICSDRFPDNNLLMK